MISIETIKLFCSTDETRDVIAKPSLILGNVVATDGRVIVEVPSMEVEPGFDDWSQNFPNYLVQLNWEAVWSAPLVPFEMPPIPPEVVTVVKCEMCEDGKWETGETCYDCDGKGSWEDHSKWVVHGDFFAFSALLVSKVSKLPALRWYVPDEIRKGDFWCRPARFCFGELGRGLLMPVRVPNELNPVTSAT